ncbi:MAG: hypothetical protein RMM98_08050 [Acidobacteriota bacterium]|nr:hypothetical protein [Blastocatellia bacterium]MDW8239552.1 hypothetical protein [Acidobacteriota bacterium]
MHLLHLVFLFMLIGSSWYVHGQTFRSWIAGTMLAPAGAAEIQAGTPQDESTSHMLDGIPQSNKIKEVPIDGRDARDFQRASRAQVETLEQAPIQALELGCAARKAITQDQTISYSLWNAPVPGCTAER